MEIYVIIQSTLKNVRDTSIKSYRELLEDGVLSERYKTILKALHELGKPSTDREIAKHLLVGDPNFVRPRRNELCDTKKYDMPLLMATERRECEVTGKTAYCWWFTEESEAVVKRLTATR